MFANIALLATAATSVLARPHDPNAEKPIPYKYAANNPEAVLPFQAIAPTSPGVPLSQYRKGKVFDRWVQIWLEDAGELDEALSVPDYAWLASQGILLTNYFGITHPSQPNYVATSAGDTFGFDADFFEQIADNTSSVTDILDDKCVSWATYLEDMPFSGFEGFEYKKQNTQINGYPNLKVDDYVRKHNPLIQFNSNTTPLRLSQQKNFTSFEKDLNNQMLPQWNHLTPNMTNNGHDTNDTFSGAWAKSFLEPLMANEYFYSRTLIHLTFDATKARNDSNRVYSVLLGGAVPEHLRGTKDDRFYNHYSALSTVEANWDLHTLGRWDVGANVFKLVADVTGDTYRDFPEVTGPNPSVFLNTSCPGPFTLTSPIDDHNNKPYPIPNTNVRSPKTGRTVLPSIVDMYSSMQDSPRMYYNDGVRIPDGDHPPPGY
ncbi:unnamed protein product [Zymoseptoria tritici ST99CH_1A5]|uniref:Acid phosphatase n=3 Tax=Zymoseptoria tritici TaxID=1047171 RepID=F9XBX4_ZYMTI|nr:uncharacterized protein MYCGRDRAFT_72002 [Zymoseptoria tritici IPO323]EGP87644.1 hypothetical protein MYCGRDRAFT_72002 [Zymoseptoria tritici IPO323]SMR52677.1 unnamed protein product [Zymoseptoria tritici ST99CH_1E4]SMR53904.1 unnamed protein product [Zymoseptoria tritici ST99CH_3D1]SMY24429.1 unnamed protein product [Zymoseptoria tritici ST99CH_1A5]